MKEFLASKKAKAFLIGLVTLVCSKLLEMSEETTKQIVQVVIAYLGAQGVADFGKGKAQAEKK